MAGTIESFVAKIHAEGIQAGKADAEKIVAEANTQAQKIVADAKDQAQKIIADAEKQGQDITERTQTELRLAARDSMLRLRQALQQALENVLAAGVQQKLDDTEFLGQMLHDLVQQTLKADIERRGILRIDVPRDKRDELVGWALKEMGRDKAESPHPKIDLKGTLRQAGFEYAFSGATVEITVDSVVQVIKEMVAPRIAELMDQASAQPATDSK